MSSQLTRLTTLIVLSNLVISTAAQATTLDTVIVTDSSSPLDTTKNSDFFAQQSHRDTGTQLRNLLGVDATRMGGHGLDPSIRGQSQTQLNVILDGAYVYGACPNRMDPPTSFVNTETYDTLRVIQGVESVQYGSGGSGGSLLFERKMPNMGTHGRIEFGGSSNAGQGSSLAAEVSTRGRLGYLRLFSLNKDVGNYTDGNGQRVRSSYRHENHGIFLGLTPSTGEQIEISAEMVKTHDALFQGAGMDSPADDMSIVRAKYFTSNPVLWADALQINLSYAANKHVMDNYTLRPAGMMRMQSPASTNTWSARLKLTNQLSSASKLDYGINWQHIERQATLINLQNQRIMSYNWPATETQHLGAFAEVVHQFNLDNRLTLGVRYDQIDARTKQFKQTPNPMSPSPEDIYYRVHGGSHHRHTAEQHWNFLARYEYDFSDTTTWFAGISRTTRTADETERYFANGANITAQGDFMQANSSAWVGNPSLKPEIHTQMDLGFHYDTEQHGLRANLFYDQVTDYILRDTIKVNNGRISSYRNVDAYLYGAQLEGYLNTFAHIRLSAGLNYTLARNERDQRHIAQTPPLSGYVAVDKRIDQLALGVRFRFQDKQTKIDTASGLDLTATPAWSIVDIYASYAANQWLTVRAGVDNVFDHAYSQHLGRADSLTGNTINLTEPGRAFWFKLSAEF